MIIVINGALGVGKTETSWKLPELFDRAVMLDGDYIGAVHPFEIYDEARIEYLYQTIRQLVMFHKRNGYDDFVINYVFETPESLGCLKRLLIDLTDVVYTFRLTCDETEMERRVRSRGGERLAWKLQRFRELTAIQEAAADRGDMGYPIDTTSLTPAQVAQTIWQITHEKVTVAPYNAGWPRQFQAEAEKIKAAVGDLALEIHHIGSTAVPSLPAKPIIDMMVVARQLDDAIACIAPLRRLGYVFVDHPQNNDRRFFKKGVPHTHHLHFVAQNSPALQRHLAFRDALRTNPELRDQYAALKQASAERYKAKRAAYTASKAAFIESVLKISQSLIPN